MVLKNRLLLIPFILLMASFLSCFGGVPRVTVENALIEEKPVDIQLRAELRPTEEVVLKFPSELQIAEVSVQTGDSVQKGQKLMTLSQPFFTLGRDKMRSKLLEKEELLGKKLYFLQNRDRLLDEGKIDQTLFDTIESETKTLEAEIAQLQADIALQTHFIDNAVVIAPISGFVTEKNVSNGATSEPGKPLLTLTQTDPLQVVFEVLPEEIQTVRDRMPVTVTVEGFENDPHTAEIFYIAPTADSERHTFEVRAMLQNPRAILKAGLDAQVRFTSPDTKQTLLLPSESVVEKEGKNIVFLVSDHKAWRREVRLRKIPESPHLVEILEGVSPTDMVVTKNPSALSDGMEVKLWR